MAPGNVIEYLEGKELALAFCVEPESKGKLAVWTAGGRKETLASKKVLFVHPSPLSGNASREEVLDYLRAAERQRQDELQRLDLEELWELLVEEGEERDWSLDELTAFLFPDAASEWHRALTYRALQEHRNYFWRKGEAFRLRTREQVEEALARQRTEARRELEREALRSWLLAVWERRAVEPPQEYRAVIEEWTGRIRDAAVWGEKSSHFGHVQRLLKDLDGKARDPAFAFMVRLGEWTEDENLDLLMNETPRDFSPSVEALAQEVAARLPEYLADPERLDLTDWPSFTVDDAETTEVDDALAFRPVEGGYQLAIHIADAASLLEPCPELLEQDMRERATSVYLPDLKVRMLPEVLADDALSLRQGEERLAFSTLVDLDSQGRLLSARLALTKIRVHQRYDYDQVDALVADGDPIWSELAQLAEQLKARREEKGALNLPFPRMEVKLGPNGSIELVPDERDSAAQTIVSEIMILANRVAADYAAEHGLPVIYRGQKEPDPPIERRVTWQPHHLFEVRKSFSRSSQGLDPVPHSGLGLDRYLQCTSPIRRFRDLVHQRQLQHHLRYGTARYDAEAMEQIMTHTSSAVSAAEKMERNRRAYFLHKWLLSHRGRELEAVVLSCTADRYVLQLCHSLREVEVPHGSGGLKSPGEKVKVKLLSVFPRDRTIKVSSP